MKKHILLILALSALAIFGCEKAAEGDKKPEPIPDPDKDKQEEEVDPPQPQPQVEEKLEAIDLGLSVAWASINVDGGARYAWGETAAKESYSWDTYVWGDPVTKYNQADGKTILDPEDDAAAVLLGSLWRIPTATEWAELIESTDLEWTWTTQNGTKGYLIKSKKNGNSIFLHATDTQSGSYWSSSLTSDEKVASSILFDVSSVDSGIDKYRYAGLALRAVSGPVFRINSKPASLTPEAQTFQVEVVSSIGYHLASAPEWITVGDVKKLGLDRYEHSFTVPANTDRGSRSGVIVFCNDNNACVPYSVSQDTSFEELLASPEQISFPYTGGTDYIGITSNVEWTVECSAPWLEISPLSGSGNATIAVKAGENYGMEPRTANIEISSANKSIVQTVSVSQEKYDGDNILVDWSRAFYHSSLFMRFTADWCGNCPLMATAAKDAVSQLPGKIVLLTLHGDSSSYLAFESFNPLANQYKVDGYPTGIVDGRRDVPNYGNTSYTTRDILKYVQETEDNYPVSSAIGVISSLDGRTLDVNIQLCIRYAAKYKVTAIVIENGIIGWQADYSYGEHSDYHHDYVARKSLTGVLGEAFEVDEDQRVVTRHYSYQVPEQYVLENLQIVVYVQRAYDGMSVIRTKDYGNYYVDNAVSVPVGEVLVPQYED